MDALDASEAQCIEKAQAFFSKQSVGQELAYIKANFELLVPCIDKMQAHRLEMNAFSLILLDVREALEAATGPCGEIVRKKFYEVLQKNPDLETIKKIGRVISGEIVDDLQISPTLIPLYKFAPLTSCDVERSFSVYKSILSDNRTNFTPEHLEQYLICNCGQRK